MTIRVTGPGRRRAGGSASASPGGGQPGAQSAVLHTFAAPAATSAGDAGSVGRETDAVAVHADAVDHPRNDNSRRRMEMEEVFVIAMVGAVNIVIAIFLYGALDSQFERLRDDIRRLEARTVPRDGARQSEVDARK